MSYRIKTTEFTIFGDIKREFASLYQFVYWSIVLRNNKVAFEITEVETDGRNVQREFPFY